MTIVAWGGVGKSTLVNHWLRRMAAEQYRSAQLVFGWSFYRQGSSGETSHFFEQQRWGILVPMGVDGQSQSQSPTEEDQLFLLMQAGLYLTATRGLAAPEARICYERAEPLCHSLGRPLLLYIGLTGQWRYSHNTEKMSAAMQIAERVHSLAQEQNDPVLMIGAYRALSFTFYYLGDFESARRYAVRGVQIWRSGGVPSHPEEVDMPVVCCLCQAALPEWHLGEIASSQAHMDEAISIAKEQQDMNSLVLALNWAAGLACHQRNPAEVDRLVSELIELSTRHNFVHWLALGTIYRGWARSASGETAEGISLIEQGIKDFRAAGSAVGLPVHLARKAEALHLANRTSEALAAINEAEALAERFEQRNFCGELHRLRGVFLTA